MTIPAWGITNTLETGAKPHRLGRAARVPDGPRGGERSSYSGGWIVAAGVAVALVATLEGSSSDARPVEYVISFDDVVVTHPDGMSENVGPEPFEAGESDGPESSPGEWTPTPGQKPPFGREPDVSREGRLLDAALEHKVIELSGPWILFNGMPIGRGRANAKKNLAENPGLYREIASRIRTLEDATRAAAGAPPGRRPPALPMAFAPGQPVAANPHFVQHGFRVESFWAVRTGSPDGYYTRAHFHPPDLASSFEGQHFGNRTELHGIHIRALDGQPFGLKSLRYRVTRNRHLPSKPSSIAGFNNFAVYVLVSRAFDPRKSVRTQFTALPVGLPMGNDPTLPWFSLPVLGFEYAEELYITSSASVDLDDIVLVRSEEESSEQTSDSSPSIETSPKTE